MLTGVTRRMDNEELEAAEGQADKGKAMEERATGCGAGSDQLLAHELFSQADKNTATGCKDWCTWLKQGHDTEYDPPLLMSHCHTMGKCRGQSDKECKVHKEDSRLPCLSPFVLGGAEMTVGSLEVH